KRHDTRHLAPRFSFRSSHAISTMRTLEILCGLFIIVGCAEAFVFSCEESQHKLINSKLAYSTQYVCLVPSDEHFAGDVKPLKRIYAQAGSVSMSFADLLNVTCIKRTTKDPWRIVADLPVKFKCRNNHFTGLALIFTSSLPHINLAELNVTKNRTITAGEDHLFVSPLTGMRIRKHECTGSGNVSVYTGAGSGICEKRILMKSWRCADLPDRIFAFDNVITLRVDSGMELTMDYERQYIDLNLTPLDQRVAVISSGRSDNLPMLNPSSNYVSYQSWMKGEDIIVSASCAPCTFDPKYESSLRLTAYDQFWSIRSQESILNESSLTRSFNFNFYVEYITTAIAAEDLWESQDNFVLELSFRAAAEGSTPRLIEKTDAPFPTKPATAMKEIDAYCGCELDRKFGMPEGWDPTEIWLDVVIVLDTSEAMGEQSLGDASSLIDSFFGSDDGDVLTTDQNAEFYTRVGLIAMSDKAEILYNLNMTKADKVGGKTLVKKGITKINVVDAFDAALNMFNDGLKSKPDRGSTRQVVYYMTDSDPKTDLGPINQFKVSQGIIIVNNFIERGEIERPGLKELASDGYYYSDIQDNYMKTIQLFCKANCYCIPAKDPYNGRSTDPAVKASGGCFHAAPIGVPFSKARSNCVNQGGGLIASIHDEEKAEFVQRLMAQVAPKSSYFWIGYSKSDAGWNWEDESTNSYTNWDTDETSTASIARCAYIDTTSPGLYWGAGNCNTGFPSVCEFAPCSVGNKN
ncbi:hypothetical protein PENTCL1PPCAC_12072, partial [Pristionchus entomophagus]